MLTPEQRRRLQQRCTELERELETLALVEDEDEVAADREASLRSELERIERQLAPGAAVRRREQGRSDADLL